MIVPHTGCLKQQEYIVKRYGDRSLKSEWCRGFFLGAMQEGSAPNLSLACGWLSSCSHGILPVYPVCVSGSKYPFSTGHQSYWIRTHPTVVIVTWFTSLKTPFPNKTTLGDPGRLEVQYMKFRGRHNSTSNTSHLYVRKLRPKPSSWRFDFGPKWLWDHVLSSHPVFSPWIENIMKKEGKKKSSFIWIYLSWDKFDDY